MPGSVPPLIYRAGEIIEPKVEGVPLGLLDDREYEQVSIQVKRDDTILLFSDGIEDQLREKDKDFGRDRFSAIVSANSQLPPQEIVQKVFDGLDAFRGATPLTDDQTFVVLKVLVDPSPITNGNFSRVPLSRRFTLLRGRKPHRSGARLRNACVCLFAKRGNQPVTRIP